jgi:hypothetical protein
VTSQDVWELTINRKPQRRKLLHSGNLFICLRYKTRSGKNRIRNLLRTDKHAYLYPAGIFSLRRRVRNRALLSLYVHVYRPSASTERTALVTLTLVAIGTQIRKATILAQRQILINQPYLIRVLTTNILFNIRNFNNSVLLSLHNENLHQNIILPFINAVMWNTIIKLYLFLLELRSLLFVPLTFAYRPRSFNDVPHGMSIGLQFYYVLLLLRSIYSVTLYVSGTKLNSYYLKD